MKLSAGYEKKALFSPAEGSLSLRLRFHMFTQHKQTSIVLYGFKFPFRTFHNIDNLCLEFKNLDENEKDLKLPLNLSLFYRFSSTANNSSFPFPIFRYLSVCAPVQLILCRLEVACLLEMLCLSRF